MALFCIRFFSNVNAEISCVSFYFEISQTVFDLKTNITPCCDLLGAQLTTGCLTPQTSIIEVDHNLAFNPFNNTPPAFSTEPPIQGQLDELVLCILWSKSYLIKCCLNVNASLYHHTLCQGCLHISEVKYKVPSVQTISLISPKLHRIIKHVYNWFGISSLNNTSIPGLDY